jgi:uncharacterized protein (TIGR04255 family)
VGKKYVKSPIVEAVCEIRFTPESRWDLTVPGLFYREVKDKFPLKENRLLRSVNIIPDKPDMTPEISDQELAVFLAEDKKTFIQLGLHVPLLSINHLGPYHSWNEFQPNIELVFGKLMGIEGVDIKGIQRIGLRYINIIEIPEKPIDPVKYFEYGIRLGEKLPQGVWNYIVSNIFRFFEGRDSCRVQLTDAVPSDPKHLAVRLDFDYYLAKPKAISTDETLDWVETAHQNVEDIFEGCITDELRKLFEEVK